MLSCKRRQIVSAVLSVLLDHQGGETRRRPKRPIISELRKVFLKISAVFQERLVAFLMAKLIR